jgi:hypothetical protein
MSKNGARKFLSFENKNLNVWKRFHRFVCKNCRQKAKSPTGRLGSMRDSLVPAAKHQTSIPTHVRIKVAIWTYCWAKHPSSGIVTVRRLSL